MAPSFPFAKESLAAAFAISSLLCSSGARAQTVELKADELALLSLEELSNMQVMSVSKRLEPLSDAAASIYVISGESMRRAGVATLPEALRLAPNLQVAQVDARNYAVTARGFNNPLENKLLVLIDGRSVYTPLFSGVFWDAQDVVLEDVDRIEVISGPGATLWGANAVNGVINIITKDAGATSGALGALAYQNDLRTGVARYGATLDKGYRYRIYGKTLRQDDTERANGVLNLTGYRRNQAGFRIDSPDHGDGFTLQGDAYDGALHQAGTADIGISGANLMGRKVMRLANGSSASLQAYWDFTERSQPGAFIEHLNTFDLQLQHSTLLGERHQLVWGAGYRYAADRLGQYSNFAFLPSRLNMHWGNLFAQDEVALTDKLRLTAGVKLENNSYTGNEFLPTVRLAWKIASNTSLWSALSRSVRSPSRIDRDFYSPTSPPVVNGVPRYGVAGGPDFESEIADVAELGYRAQLASTVSYSATAFYSQYDRLRTLEPNMAGPGSVFRNLGKGVTRGLEMWATWQATARWRWNAGLVAQRVHTSVRPESRDRIALTGLPTSDPSNYWSIRSSYDFAKGHGLDLSVRHSGRLNSSAVPAYTAVDLSYMVRLRPGLDLSIVGRNLFDPQHPEFGSAPLRSEYRRSIFAKLVWQL